MGIAIYGTGGFGREVAELAKRRTAGSSDHTGSSIVFVDDSDERPETINGLPVLSFDELKHAGHSVVVAIADSETRKRVEQRCESADIAVRTLIASTAILPADFSALGAGSVIADFCTITVDARIGRSFQSNIYSYVAHDCVIGNYVTFAPRVCCNGNVHVGDMVYVGTGASIIQGSREEPLVIGAGAVISMGAVVTKRVEPNTLVAGTPARFVKTLR